VLSARSLNSASATVIVLPPAGTTTEPDPATVKSAVADFKNLSAKEKRAKVET